MNKYSQGKISFPSKTYNCKTFEKSNLTTALNILFKRNNIKTSWEFLQLKLSSFFKNRKNFTDDEKCFLFDLKSSFCSEDI